jgi:hypothetical protein
LAALAVLSLYLIAPALRQEQGPWDSFAWGVRFFSRVPPVWRWTSVGIAAAMCLAAGPLSRAWVWLAQRCPRPRHFNRYLLVGALVVTATVVFWLVRTRCYYGDWHEILRDISSGEKWRERSPLDFFLRSVSGRFLALRWPERLAVPPPLVNCLDHPTPVVETFDRLRAVQAAISCLAGGLFAGAIALMGRFLLRLRPERWLFGLLVLGQGSVLLFCGYIETYTWVTTVAALYLLLAVLALQGRIALVWPAVALTITVGFHLQALYLLPSFLVLLLLRFAGEGRERLAWVGGFVKAVAAGLLPLFVLTAAFLLAGYDLGLLPTAAVGVGGTDGVLFKHLLHPLPNTREPYPILSWTHLRAVLNQQLLVAPLSLFVGMAVCVFLGFAEIRKDPQFLFLLGAALPALLFTAIYNPDLGPRQDWDLLAPPAVLVTIASAYVLLARVPRTRVRLTTGITWLVVSLLHSGAWVLVNRLGL